MDLLDSDFSRLFEANLPPQAFQAWQLTDDRLQAAAIASEQSGTATPILKEELRLRILKRRVEEGKPEIRLDHSPPRQYQMTPAEQEKRERRKDQNRRAAQRCREKKKAEQDEVYKTHECQRQRNVQLRKDVSDLRTHLASLRRSFLTHMTVCTLLSPRTQQQDQQQDRSQKSSQQRQEPVPVTSEAPLLSTGFEYTSPSLGDLFPNGIQVQDLEPVSAIDDLKDLKTAELHSFAGQENGGAGEMWGVGGHRGEEMGASAAVSSVFAAASEAIFQMASSTAAKTEPTPSRVSAWSPTSVSSQHFTAANTGLTPSGVTACSNPISTVPHQVTASNVWSTTSAVAQLSIPASIVSTAEIDYNDLPGYPFSQRRQQNTTGENEEPPRKRSRTTAPTSGSFPNAASSPSPNPPPYSVSSPPPVFSCPNFLTSTPLPKTATPPPPSPQAPQQVVPGTAEPTPATSPAPFFDDNLAHQLDSCSAVVIPERDCLSNTLPDFFLDDYFMSSQED